MVVTKSGTILAFAERRVDGHEDEGNIDVVLRRSTDGGKSWGPMQVLVDDKNNPCKNQSPVVLPDGRVILLYLWNPYIKSEDQRSQISRKMYMISSDDDGKSWSNKSPEKLGTEITAMTQQKDWKWTGLGPVHGIVKQFAPNKGRIVFSSRHNTENSNMVSHVIYSDDNGKTWAIGGSVPRLKTTESTVVELSNGDLMLNSRNQREDEHFRVVSISRDGGESFKEADVRLETQLVEPRGVQASLLFHSINKTTGKANVLFSNPADTELRTNGTIYLSEDDGETWTSKFRYAPELRPYFTGYSDLARFGNGDVAVLYERGEYNASNKGQRYDEIGFHRIAFSTIQSGWQPRKTCRIFRGFSEDAKIFDKNVLREECVSLCERNSAGLNDNGLPKQVRCEWAAETLQDYQKGQCEIKSCLKDKSSKVRSFKDFTRKECSSECGRADGWSERRCRWHSGNETDGPWQLLLAGQECK